MKNKNWSAIIFGFAIVLAAVFLGKAYVDSRSTKGEISVTGLGKTDFVSDLIVWEGNFSAFSSELKDAYTALNKDKNTIRKYLVNKGVKSEDIIFTAVQTDQRTKRNYSKDGDYLGEDFVGYVLKQSLSIESTEVNKIENISREITELLNQDVKFYSEAPRYYYTKLADLKIEMISKATEDARIRAENIAKFSGGKLGVLESAKMGIFQITGQNSSDNFSWGGTFNTSDKKKTASITMKLVYEVD